VFYFFEEYLSLLTINTYL